MRKGETGDMAADTRTDDNRRRSSPGKVVVNITMSLDGFIAAPNVDLERPLGDGGERLHYWAFGDGSTPASAADREVAGELFTSTGAFLIGRRTFDVGEGPWGEDGAFGRPCFVLTHRGRELLRRGPTTFTFVTDGIESALAQARAAAGDRDVCVMGGAGIAQQYLAAGLIDELHLHLAPVLLGAGTRLFEPLGAERIELECTRLIASPGATHLRFRVVK